MNPTKKCFFFTFRAPFRPEDSFFFRFKQTRLFNNFRLVFLNRLRNNCVRSKSQKFQASDDKGVDYAKLIERFGSTPISQELLDRCEALTGKKVHRFLRRGIFFSHREFEQILGKGDFLTQFY